jgi:hypothetical protein
LHVFAICYRYNAMTTFVKQNNVVYCFVSLTIACFCFMMVVYLFIILTFCFSFLLVYDCRRYNHINKKIHVMFYDGL